MNTANQPLIGGIEAGGTKFVLAVGHFGAEDLAGGHSPPQILARHSIATTSPTETLASAAEWFEQQGAITALGIASFGPADLDRNSPTWGHITKTPKMGWSHCDIAGYLAKRLAVPVGFDTDVNAAALAEFRYGAGRDDERDVSSLAYITVGTGVGGGLVIQGQPVHGCAHPEMGHIFPRRHSDDIEFAGICPHHGDCLEGLASGSAIMARWGVSLSQLPTDHVAHEIIAHYLAQACHSLFAVTACETIVLGGGVMKTPGLWQNVKKAAAKLGANYLPGQSKHQIVEPALGENSGIIGALSLAAR